MTTAQIITVIVLALFAAFLFCLIKKLPDNSHAVKEYADHIEAFVADIDEATRRIDPYQLDYGHEIIEAIQDATLKLGWVIEEMRAFKPVRAGVLRGG